MSLFHEPFPTFDEVPVVYCSGRRRRRRHISLDNDEEETGNESGDNNQDDLVSDHDFEEIREEEWKCTVGFLVNLRLRFFRIDLCIFSFFFLFRNHYGSTKYIFQEKTESWRWVNRSARSDGIYQNIHPPLNLQGNTCCCFLLDLELKFCFRNIFPSFLTLVAVSDLFTKWGIKYCSFILKD